MNDLDALRRKVEGDRMMLLQMIRHQPSGDLYIYDQARGLAGPLYQPDWIVGHKPRDDWRQRANTLPDEDFEPDDTWLDSQTWGLIAGDN